MIIGTLKDPHPSNIINTGERLKDQEEDKHATFTSLLFNTVMEVLVRAIK